MSTAIYNDVRKTSIEIGYWLTKIALLYLSIPVFIFLIYWLNLGASLFFSIILLIGISQVWVLKPEQPQMSFTEVLNYIIRNNIYVFGLFFLWLGLSGTGGIGFQNSDYAASNALLKDLINNPWPLYLREKVPLVYYFFYYLPAASFGKWFGWEAANIFLFAWTYLGLLIAWSILALILDFRKLGFWKQVSAALIFILFGGWDQLGGLTTNNSGYLQPGAHIEWWAGIGQFSSNTTLLFWVPQHTIAPWIATATILLALLNNIGKYAVPMIATLSFMWSPIASLGTLPLLCVLMVFNRSRKDWATSSEMVGLMISPFLAFLGFIYYSSNMFSFPLEWQITRPAFISSYLLFIALECIPLGIPFFCQHLRQKIFLSELSLPPPLKLNSREKTVGWVAIGTLLFLPFYKLGIMNDLCMRASIPALMVLSVFFLKILRREFTFQYLQYSAVAVCFLLGTGAAINELIRSVQYFSLKIPALESVSSLLNSPENSIIEQRAGNSNAFFWHWMGPFQTHQSLESNSKAHSE